MSKIWIIFLRIIVVLVAILIALGAATRAMNAGLACPSWPLCFGKIIPDYHPQVYFEFIHRTVAGLIGILTLIFSIKLLRSKESMRLKVLIGFSLILLLCQIALGALTVTELLKYQIVTLHLIFGISFWSVLMWILFSLSTRNNNFIEPVPLRFSALIVLLFMVIYIQIILGGLVSSNYAGLACPDFPLCQGQWIPTFDGLIGYQVIHRLGAYVTFLFVLLLFIRTILNQNKRWRSRSIKKYSKF